MKIVYTNLSPVTNSYTNFNHILLLKKYNINKAIICIWDLFVYDTQIFKDNLPKNVTKEEKLRQNVANIENLLDYLKIDYKIIYFSEAWERMFKNSRHSADFHRILSTIKLEDINRHNIKYSPFGKISIAKMHYIIADFLFAINLPSLFPELCDSIPSLYLTSERFKPFKEPIISALNPLLPSYKFPEVAFVDYVPVVMNKEGEIPSLETSPAKIKSILSDYFEKDIPVKEIYELLKVVGYFNQDFKYKDKSYSFAAFAELIARSNNTKKTEILLGCMLSYFQCITKIISKAKVDRGIRATFISKMDEFNIKVKPLNGLKILILQQCNGANSSLDIAKLTGLKLSTVSTYLTHLKNAKIISDAKKPTLIFEKIVIDLKNMEATK